MKLLQKVNSHMQKQGIITLLPKNNKPRDKIKNWRPITLLNIEYKLVASVLANRMKKVLPKKIEQEQKGFLSDRYIGENVRPVYDTVHCMKHKNLVGMILLIDFEKAFDPLEWDYLKLVLKKYNIGDDFLTWFSTLYNDCNSCVINNGFFSSFF